MALGLRIDGVIAIALPVAMVAMGAWPLGLEGWRKEHARHSFADSLQKEFDMLEQQI
jgi:hypothetical protein